MPTGEGVSLDAGRDEVMAADRAFNAQTQAHGPDGWMAYMAPDAARLPQMGMTAVLGLDEIRRGDAAIFADPAKRMTWSPTDGGVFADRKHGFTTGRFQVHMQQADGSARLLAQGAYVTFWRREPDGGWRVILDTGAMDPLPTSKS